MPAEWAPHEMTLVARPQREDAWRGTTIEDARDTHAEVVAAIAEFEPVLLVVDPPRRATPAGGCRRKNVEIFEARSTIPGSGIPGRSSSPAKAAGPESTSPSTPGGRFPRQRRGDRRSHPRSPGNREDQLRPGPEGGSIAGRRGGDAGHDRAMPAQLEPESRSRPGGDRSRTGFQTRYRDVRLARPGLIEDEDTDGHVDNICAFIEPGRVLLQTAPEGDPNVPNARPTSPDSSTPDSRGGRTRSTPADRRRGDSVVVRTRTSTSPTAP